MTKQPNKKCDFCGNSKEDVERLIVGECSAICNDCVELCGTLLAEEKVKNFPLDKKILNPADVKEFLDGYVIGQEDAKIALSVAVSQHFKRCRTRKD